MPEKIDLSKEEIEHILNLLGQKLSACIPPGFGFALFLMETDREDGSQVYHISSVKKEHFIMVLEEYLKREGHLSFPMRGSKIPS